MIRALLYVYSVFPGDFLLQTFCRLFAPALLSPRPSPIPLYNAINQHVCFVGCYQTLLMAKALEMRMNHGNASCCSSEMAKVMASDNFLRFWK